MLIKPGGEIPSSEITPRGVYLDRRRFLGRSAKIAAGVALAPGVLVGCDSASGREASAGYTPGTAHGLIPATGQERDWSQVLSDCRYAS